VAILLRMPVEFISVALPPLLRGPNSPWELHEHDGSRYLVWPNFVAAQEAKQSDRQRQKASRERRRAMARRELVVTGCDAAGTSSDASQSKQNCDTGATPRDPTVTPSDAGVTARSETVTTGHTVSHSSLSSLASSGSSEEAEAILAELDGHDALGAVADRRRLADQVAGDMLSSGKPLSWVLDAIRGTARQLETEDAGGEPSTGGRIASRVRAVCRKARAPRTEPADEALAVSDGTHGQAMLDHFMGK
jgi:hypothetical protein